MIRRAENCDIKGIRSLLLQVLQVHHVGRPDLFKEVGYKYTEEELAQIIADDEKPVFVYVDENSQVLGHCFCVINHIKESEAVYQYKNLYIDDLVVDEKHRGEHIASQLYNYVKEYAKQTGVYNITLHAWAKNPNAVGFYEHMGLTYQQYTMEEVLDK